MNDLSNVPTDLRAALIENRPARDLFERLDPSHRIEIVKWVEGAREPEHRAQRVQLAVKLILESPG